MYRHILIPADGSELAERAVTHGLSLATAKALGIEVPPTLLARADEVIDVNRRPKLTPDRRPILTPLSGVS
jgi:nucleotide-binding universal stress UspA family protein